MQQVQQIQQEQYTKQKYSRCQSATHPAQTPHSEDVADDPAHARVRAGLKGRVGQKRDHIPDGEGQDEVGGDVVAFRHSIRELRELLSTQNEAARKQGRVG